MTFEELMEFAGGCAPLDARPECRHVIDAHILIRDNKVSMRKRCPSHGLFEALVYDDAQHTPILRSSILI
jgi:hypothetical protein